MGEGVGKLRLLLVDDHPLVRDGIKAGLSSLGHLTVVGEAASGEQALQMAAELRPDVALVDIGLPGMNGLEVTRRLSALHPQLRIVVLTVYDEREYALQALRAGARWCVLKNSPASELCTALAVVGRGELYFSTDIARMAVHDYARQKAEATRAELTPREREVLALIAEGRSSKEVAGELCISVRTVETHRQNTMNKLGIHTAAGLIRYAIEEGIVRVH
ncbi:MAG: response regulator transcription factor [Candidatus Latescibacterota bacterium]